MYWGIYKQQVCHSWFQRLESARWMIQNIELLSGESLFPGSNTGIFNVFPWRKKVLHSSFISKALRPNTTSLGISIQHIHFGEGTNIWSLYVSNCLADSVMSIYY